MEVSFAAGRPGDIKKFTLHKFDLVYFKSIKAKRLRTAGFIPQNVARVGCVACLASVAVAPRLPSPCSCSFAARWAWTQSHYAFVRDPIPQAFSPHPGDSPVEPGPRKSVKSLEFEVGPRALGRIRTGATDA